MLLQLDMFHEYTDVEILEQRVISVEKSLDKQRKALFARHGELAKKYMELNERFDVLESVLCRGKFGQLG